MMRVINFSGGKTSAFMTITEYREGDIVLFCDTGREHPKTYKFINDFEAFENIPVERIAYEGGFERLLEKRQAIPNQFKRFCTLELKIKTARRYLRSLGLMEYQNMIGFRYDEPLRVKRHRNYWQKVIATFPLYAQGIDKSMVNDYWSKKSYTLEIPSIFGNCDLCPVYKGKNAVMAILTHSPELGDKWIADEERNKKGNTYFEGITIKQLKSIAQNNLFKDYNLEEMSPAFNCACTT